ncbi:hypothetical protein B6K86_08730 [Lachnospiraceae bacterium]|nr:hypothetical protein B6K86_08730 [Lachnospiraceae bacterium]
MDESYSSLLAAGIEKKYRQLEMEIMEDVVRRIRKAGTITDSADWQINRLRILGTSAREIEDMLRKAVRGNEEEVRRLYAEVIEREYTRDKELYEKAGKDFIPYEQNPELQQITDALVDQSTAELYNITKSAGFMIDMGGSKGKVFTPLADVYNSFLDDAITGMVNGAYDYNTLVRRMVSRMTGSGLRTDHAFKTENGGDWGIDYASGWHNRIDVAARRALLTGFNQLAGTVTDMNAQRLGTNLFEVSWHPGARPSHTVWQGRIYTKEELASKCGLGTGPGLCGWSCHHNYYSFVPGVSQRNWSDAWLKEMNARENTPRRFRGREYTTYQATQKQRQMETALRARREQVQLLRHAEADPHDITTARCKYQAQLDEYKRFSKTMGLPEQMERVYTGRTGGRIAPSQKVYQEYLHQLDIKRTDAILKNEAKTISFRGKLTCDVQPINVKDFTFNEAHINAEREHGVTRAEAERYIQEATFKAERWNGRFINYYGPNGSVYVDTQLKEIKTAFKADEYGEKIIRMLEVLDDGTN